MTGAPKNYAAKYLAGGDAITLIGVEFNQIAIGTRQSEKKSQKR
jgi:hypothetical protein